MSDTQKLYLGPISPAIPGPLYRQIIDAIKREVAAGRLPPDSALPSFRALAEDLLVSLITVKRAYEELEREGVIYRRQGIGTFVAERGADRTRAAQGEVAREALRAAIDAGRQAGLSDVDLIDLLHQELEITGVSRP
jgi:GntR family transcriptional regulator